MKIVSRQIAGHIQLGTVDLRLFQLRRYRSDDPGNELILQIEDVEQVTVKPICPQMTARLGFDELPGHAHTIARLAQATFQHVTDAEFRAIVFV